MTSKIYRTAQGKTVDLGTIMLQNEHVRAVGNMKVNARGDKIDNTNRVVETRPERIQRQNDRSTTNVSAAPVHTSSQKAKQNIPTTPAVDPTPTPPVVEIKTSAPAVELDPPVVEAPPPQAITPPPVKRSLNTTAPKSSTKPAVDPTPAPVVAKTTTPPAESTQTQPGGLASAIARSREIKQDLDRTRRQTAQDSGVRKI